LCKIRAPGCSIVRDKIWLYSLRSFYIWFTNSLGSIAVHDVTLLEEGIAFSAGIFHGTVLSLSSPINFREPIISVYHNQCSAFTSIYQFQFLLPLSCRWSTPEASQSREPIKLPPKQRAPRQHSALLYKPRISRTRRYLPK